ncbi:hypothetical protein [Longimicrobium terrae]|uniref:SAV-6107-like HEPN domain-containing protein n=1 Tax=Longimicrobium terrae TaxID=1639882 RepID=A0A841GTY5_9BACT|nr:hypothetical protein [Longimicrobium terrae]MBB4634696.1 hypothetical protein [Longimicrobium terrae]MBB6068414.1 hypothetical protein [Longimicrobium terrae]NNC32694.1 hypothetical protein [Longimicrobium terrae]
MNERINALIQMGRLVAHEAPDEEIAGVWENAVEAWTDASLTIRSANRRLTSAYDAGRIAVLAVVRAANLRVRAQNHHEVTLATAGLLAGGELQGMLQEFQALRLERVQIEYGWRTRASAADVERATAAVGGIMKLAAGWISTRRPLVVLVRLP